MWIDLHPHEIQRLLALGEMALGEMRVEVRRTSTPNYHDSLVAERDLLQEIVQKLRSYSEQMQR